MFYMSAVVVVASALDYYDGGVGTIPTQAIWYVSSCSSLVSQWQIRER